MRLGFATQSPRRRACAAGVVVLAALFGLLPFFWKGSLSSHFMGQPRLMDDPLLFSVDNGETSRRPKKRTLAVDKLMGQLQSGDPEFTEERIQEMLRHPNISFEACDHWDPDRLRRAYVNIVPGFHDDSKDAQIADEQKRRQASLTEACKSPNIADSNMMLSEAQRSTIFQHLLVNDNHKMIYCSIPKIGCTNWKKVLKVLSERDAWPGCHKLEHRIDGVRLSTYSKEERIHRLKTYYKFMFVRDPLDRLVSAYLDKFHPSGRGYEKGFPKHYVPHIVKKYRKPPLSAEQRKKARGDDVKFTEFANYVADTKRHMYNEHWAPYEDLCQPCLVDYDFIGHYEQLTEESNYVLRQAKAGGRVAYPGRQTYYHTSPRSRVLSYYHQLNTTMQKRILDIYDTSYNVFAFEKPELSNPEPLE
eukprot:scpid73378/ scgid9728/ Carbohydrate sulfotransferase 14; Dermatan 4-sulfotransferase 1